MLIKSLILILSGGPIWAIAVAVIVSCIIIDIAVWRGYKRKKYAFPVVTRIVYIYL
jgi:hypothetical protein